MKFKTGLHKNINESEYHSASFGDWGPLLSSSGLKQFMRSPAHFRMSYDYPGEQTQAMKFGSAFHKYVLEHDQFRDEYAIAPDCDKRTKIGKQVWTNFVDSTSAGVTILTQDEGHRIREMMLKISRFGPANEIIGQAVGKEITALWKDAGSVLCKARLDIMGKNSVSDIKTAGDPGYDGFLKSVKKYRYDIQAAFYCRAVEKCTAKKCDDFKFIVVGSKPPHDINVFRIKPADIRAAWQEIEVYVDQYRDCCDSGEWPGVRDLDFGMDNNMDLTFNGEGFEI